MCPMDGCFGKGIIKTKKRGVILSITKTKDEVNKHKKDAMRKLNRLLEYCIFSEDTTLLKKADLISYWLESFSDYISFEDKFESNRLIRYSRGNVIRLNFGFNVGKEIGGLHYAVVIDNDNKRSADVLTVVPLSSSDGKRIHERSVDLGTELFEKINIVQENLLSTATQELIDLMKIHDALNTSINVFKHYKDLGEEIPAEILDQLPDVLESQNEIAGKIDTLQKKIDTLTRNNIEISKLKMGSMAVTNQITTVSKQRIYTPKRSEDFLYGISLSPSAMDKINNKLKELYIFE